MALTISYLAPDWILVLRTLDAFEHYTSQGQSSLFSRDIEDQLRLELDDFDGEELCLSLDVLKQAGLVKRSTTIYRLAGTPEERAHFRALHRPCRLVPEKRLRPQTVLAS